MAASRCTDTGAQPVSPRRRGPVLERAILDAALEQLSTVGWSGLTMEGVAAGAGTGKAAVYRRWPSKAELVADALRSGFAGLDDAPDHGSVREDLYQLCLRIRGTMYSRSGHALRSVLYECDGAAADGFQELILHRVIEPANRLLREVVRRGVERGDVRPDVTGDLVFDVIPGLMMYRSKLCGSEWSEADIAAMVDQVMVPLLRPRAG
ncbi:TetR/AcrR family transcriptional regulator C-terminal ligand-binding domain-containing protein [Streptomyces sp. NPDC001828]|uniref:TetR/AcrR family transcriptional regulator n=1 Tax=Streptomyces sp. NPDC001828 TaxID=3364615 RepID=UPI0036C41861